MVEISKSRAKDFIDVCIAIKGTPVNSAVLKSLIKINYFKCFGSVKKVMETYAVYEKWTSSSGQRKTMKLSEVESCGIPTYELRRYATNITSSGKVGKTYQITDWIGLVKAIARQIPDEEYGKLQLVKFQYEVLQYVEMTIPDIEWRFVVVTDLDTTYSPKFSAYCLQNGKSTPMKVHKKKNARDKRIQMGFLETPFKDGDILYLKDVKRENQRKNIDGKWVENPEIKDWWVKDYMVVQ